MELINFRFRFIPSNTSFEKITYLFDVMSDLKTYEDGKLEQAMGPYKIIERILNETYPDFKKSQEDKVTESSLIFNLRYNSRSNLLTSLSMSYDIALDKSGVPNKTNLYLGDSANDLPRSFTLFDSIMNMSGLIISEEVKSPINRINALRRNLPSEKLELRL